VMASPNILWRNERTSKWTRLARGLVAFRESE
jgi:hypothetical protein